MTKNYIDNIASDINNAIRNFAFELMDNAKEEYSAEEFQQIMEYAVENMPLGLLFDDFLEVDEIFE